MDLLSSLLLLIFLRILYGFYRLYTTHGVRTGTKTNSYAVTCDLHPLLKQSATNLAKAIKRKEISSQELLKLFINQAESVNKDLNAVVKLRFEEALKEAKEADRILKECKNVDLLPMFHGVPTFIKETFAVKGMPHTSGMVSRKNVVAKSDATCVQRMRSAGFIVMGVTNLSELCMWMESDNKVYGRTNNPYDHGRTCGGSSGGEAAIIAACGATCGLASDVGGSIRMPAFFNGIYGHKPTGGCIPNTGQYPLAVDEIQRVCQPGPLARYPEDLFPLLKILAGPDGHDSGCYSFELKSPSSVDISSLSVLSIDVEASMGSRLFMSACDLDLLNAQDKVADYLRNVGCNVKKIVFPELKNAFELWSAVMDSADQPPYRVLLEKPGTGAFKELLNVFMGWPSDNTFPSIMLAILERATELVPGVTARFDIFLKKAKDLRVKFNETVGKNSIMLLPPHPLVAPLHGHPLWNPMNFAYTGIFNATQLPVTSVPLGLNKDGIPLGIQIIAGNEQDHLTIAVALELHKKFGGWIPPSPIS